MRRIGKVTTVEKLDCSFHIYVNVLHTYTDLYKIRKPPLISNLNTFIIRDHIMIKLRWSVFLFSSK